MNTPKKILEELKEVMITKSNTLTVVYTIKFTLLNF